MTAFLSSILPDTGNYCLVAIKKGKVRQSFTASLEDLQANADAASSHGFDAYYALATFGDPALGRTAANAVELRSFFLDLDVGPDKAYKLQADAAAALRAFIDATGLPTPTIINSGGGLHVYWPLATPIAATEWVEVARRLKSLCRAHNLDADPAVTSDAARILRVPGTNNYKAAHERPVQIVRSSGAYTLEQIVACLPTAAPSVASLSAAKAFGTDEATKDLAGEEHPPSDFAKLVRLSVAGNGCGQIKHAVEEAAVLAEPLWRAMLSIAVRCEDGATAIHTASQAHPEYNADRTERKAAETKGPYTCEWYRENNPMHCKGCKQQVTSPIALGRVIKEAEAVNDTYIVEVERPGTDEHLVVEVPVYPKPYFRGAAGGVYRRMMVDDEPVDVEIYPHDLYVTNRFFDSDEHGDGDGELVGINLHTPLDGVRRFHARVKDLFSKDALRDLLNKHGGVVYGKQVDVLMAFFSSSIRKLQSQFAAARTRSQMGWTPDMQGFVIGELEYVDGEIKLAPPASSTRQLAPAFTPKGDLEVWKSMASFYTREGMEPHALALLAGFGAPLLKLLGDTSVKGAIIHLKSNASGSGKTTAQHMINSIFGHPFELLLTQKDTYASKMHRIGMMNNIAVTVDEITNTPDLELSELAYSFTTGRAKHRMEAQTNKLRINNTTWCTFTVTSSNASMLDKLANLKATADGEMRRVLEIEVPRTAGVAKQEVETLFAGLADNYGLAGPVFIKHVMAHREDVITALLDMRNKIDAAIGFEQNDRFHSNALTCMFVAGVIARDLKLLDWDIPKLYKYAIDLCKHNRVQQAYSVGSQLVVAEEALAAYIAENVNNVFVVNSGSKGGIPPAPIAEPRGALKMRYEADTKELFISATELRNFFTKRQVDVRESLRELAAAGYVKNNGTALSKRLTSGAVGGIVGMPVRCYTIDGACLGLETDSFTGANGAATP